MACCKFPSSHVGAQLKALAHAYTRRFEETARKNGMDELTIMHGRILGYLCVNAGADVYQRDLEEAFSINRSSVAGVVKLMERKGYISRERVAGDARLKKLSLTPLGLEMQARAETSFRQVETLAVQGLTPAEIETFLALSARMRKNLSMQKEHTPC